MPRVALPPIALVALAGLGDAVGLHAASFFLLVLAVPAAAIAALVSLDGSFSKPAGATRALAHAWLQGLALVFLLVASAARAPARGGRARAPGGGRAAAGRQLRFERHRHVQRADPAEVVVERARRREPADDHEPDPGAAPRGGEEENLADEPAGRRQAGE